MGCSLVMGHRSLRSERGQMASASSTGRAPPGYGPVMAGSPPPPVGTDSSPQVGRRTGRRSPGRGDGGAVPGPADSLRDAARDLLLGSACVGCAAPGRVLCPVCETTLPRRGSAAWPSPTPPGLALPFAAGAYDGLLKALVNAHKEHAVH